MKISPSILACNFARLEENIKMVSPFCQYIHIDVMDGVFVNNISIGIPVVKSLRGLFDNVFDVHLMIIDPLKYIEAFANAGSDIITFHVEAQSNIEATIKKIKECGKKAGISIKPNTKVEGIRPYLKDLDLVLVMSVEPGFGGQKFMPSAIDKIRELKQLKDKNGYHYEIEVDGGINAETAKLVKDAGADVIVAGSFVFNSLNPKETIDKLN